MKVKIKKDDTVKVIAGRDRGKTGRVLQVDAEKGKVLVEGVSMLKRHTRPNPQKQIKGGIAERESADCDFKRDGDDRGWRGHARGLSRRRQPFGARRQKGRRDVG